MPNPTGIITATEAQELNDNWTNLRASANRTAAGQDDNRSSWYSLEDMENFLQLIKDENPTVNGVRFYLGVETTKQDPQGLTTIFMVPTEEKNGENADIRDANGMDRGSVGGGRSYPQ
ncbi:hypothetical protein [Lacinutrix sp. 5H-3-7-4]|uniref:hypothetical protein n=1 Tax=Lacinutrix sp. (strain 5H-3-7-4) TaxID=983544 RepID=UPI00020A3831|nr:hypothetical protein [Lacinutrix sp. 5H-3-7-4]AEH02133.1 hypothetical protein Lacal_2291 [Lacinutrix sp. 5H-3-7-4]